MDYDYLKKTQSTSLELLKIFIDICQKYNLRYYLGGGSMLGAIRHKGFIPWDDDVDIDMPRKDYQKFLEIADEALKDYPYFEVLNFYKGNDITICAKLVDNRLKLEVTNTAFTAFDKYTYIGVDIIPIDAIPDNYILRKLHFFRLNVLRCFFKLSTIKFGGVVANEKKKTKREWYKKLLVFLGENLPVEKIFKIDVWARKYDNALMKYSFDDCKMAGTLDSHHGMKSIFPVEWYGKGKKYQFEDIEAIGVDNYDAWLTQLYGDYMKLPPESEREWHGWKMVKD